MRASALALAALAVTALVACGGGGGGGGGGLSAPEFRRRANGICGQFGAQARKLPQPRTQKQVVSFVEKLKPLFDRMLSRLREVEAPDDLADDYDKWLDAEGEVSDRLDRVRTAAKEGDRELVQNILREGGRLERKNDVIARRIGLKTCAGL